jgi:hypothetical protein
LISFRNWPVLPSLALAGCTGQLPAPTAPQPAPPNYAQLAAAYLAGLPKPPPAAGASISAIQPAVAPQPGDWFTCFKTASGETFAVFFSAGAVIDARSALNVDGCASAEGYLPLPPPKSAAKPATKPAAKPAKSKKGSKG